MSMNRYSSSMTKLSSYIGSLCLENNGFYLVRMSRIIVRNLYKVQKVNPIIISIDDNEDIVPIFDLTITLWMIA